MNRTLLLAAASVLALGASGASALQLPARSVARKIHPVPIPKGARLLYSQNSNANGSSVNSQNFTSGTFSIYDDQGADDFVVPKHIVWTVRDVDVSGTYYNGSAPARSEQIIFYKDDRGEPGPAVKHGKFDNLTGVDKDGSFAIRLSHQGLVLGPGTYWVSVIADCSYESGCGQWGWAVTSVQHGNQAMWQLPAFGSGCPTWGTIEYCITGETGPDFMFDLRGVSGRQP